jgi:hypothetical protein
MYPSWPPKLATEKLDYAVDMSARLAPGENISEVIWSAPVALKVEQQTISGPLLTALISGGSPGHHHPVTITARTTAGRILAERILLPVR